MSRTESLAWGVRLPFPQSPILRQIHPFPPPRHRRIPLANHRSHPHRLPKNHHPEAEVSPYLPVILSHKRQANPQPRRISRLSSNGVRKKVTRESKRTSYYEQYS